MPDSAGVSERARGWGTWFQINPTSPHRERRACFRFEEPRESSRTFRAAVHATETILARLSLILDQGKRIVNKSSSL